ncbi:hypothetical protein SCOCK_480026 [Actinacidiphila cocklensis]|uniref:Uncharacterized protein n=1 Tax=Actinacidiphila cocklensis TaxID=887465 RepID=A0A9W4EA25_9ACTN|nr:hypothetical protein SCOCK_480026 [Actinacidiphila cocklensis]
MWSRRAAPRWLTPSQRASHGSTRPYQFPGAAPALSAQEWTHQGRGELRARPPTGGEATAHRKGSPSRGRAGRVF